MQPADISAKPGADSLKHAEQIGLCKGRAHLLFLPPAQQGFFPPVAKFHGDQEQGKPGQA